MKAAICICIFALLQQAFSQCLPAPTCCLSPPAMDLFPSCSSPAVLPLILPAPAPACPCPCPDLSSLAPALASTLSASLAATLPPLLEAALPTVLTSALAAAGPLLEAMPCGACPPPPGPIVYAVAAPSPCAPPPATCTPAPAPCAPAPATCAPAPACAQTPIYYAVPAPPTCLCL